MAVLSSPQTINAVDSWKDVNTCLPYPTQSMRWTLATATERRVSACQEKTLKGANPRI